MLLPRTSLHVICDQDVCAQHGWSVPDFATACLEGGALVLQMRVKTASGQELLETAMAMVDRARPFGAAVVINDRADIALLAGAHGVHVGQDDLTPAQVRSVIGAAAIVGRSTHTRVQIDSALEEPISYLALGPLFNTVTKATGYEALGVEAMRMAAARAATRDLPLIAIGGITLERAPAARAAGAQAVAVISDLFAGNDPAVRVRQYLDALR